MAGHFDFRVWSKSFAFTTMMGSLYPILLNLSHALAPSMRTSTPFSVALWVATFVAYFVALNAVARNLRAKYGSLKAETPRSRLSPQQLLVWKLASALSLVGRAAAVFLGASNAPHRPWLSARMADMPGGLRDYAVMVAFIVAMDGLFYLSHRAQHSNRLLYNIPEKLFNSFIQVYLTAQLLVPVSFYNLHFIVYGVFFSEILGHSGVALRMTPPYTPVLDIFDLAITIEGHDLHHRVSSRNFGKQTVIYDKLFGTYRPDLETRRKDNASHT